jgi:hypothetical protein
MSDFQNQLAADLANVFFNPDELGKSVIYTPSGGAGVAITVIPVGEDLSGQVPAPPVDMMVILVQYTDAAAPAHGDTYANPLTGVTWYHEEIVSGGPESGIWHIRVTRSARRDLGRRLS